MSELRSDVRFRSGRVRKKRRASSKTPLFASQHAPLLKVALGLFAVHIVGAPMLLGGVHAWAIVTIAISACLCLIAAAVAARARLSDTAPIVVWVAVGLLAWTALQVLPLPCSLVSMLAPDAVATLRADRAMLGLSSPATCRLTLDPGGTQEEVLKGVAIVASLLAAWLLARAKAHREVLWMVAASSLVMSAVALVHGLGRMDEVFGLYTPQRAGRQLLLAPLMNQNNLGAFAAMGVPLWIALTHRVRSPGVRWLGLAAVITTVATALLSLSRGAIAQLLVSLLLVLWVVQVSPRRSSGRPLAQRLLRPLATVLAIAIAGAGVLYAASDRLASELENRDLSKLTLIRRAFQLALDHLWVGIGRGAFASAFVHLEGASARFGYAENFVVQWLSEWGAPITLLWLAVAARALYDAARGSESLARQGALIALFGLVLQNLVDLGFEVLGMAVVAAALFAAIVASARPEPNPVSTPRSLYAPTFLVLGGAIAALLLIAPHIGAQSVSELDAKLRQQMHADDRPGFRATLREAMQLHPGEPQLAVIAATEALRHDDRSTAKWINHVMKLAPKWGAPHALAFQWLWSKGRRQQALLELRAAAEIDPRPWQPLTCSVARVSGNWVVAAAPSGAERQRYLELATMCIEPTHRSAAVIDETLMAEFPKRPIGFQRAAFRVAESGRVDEGLGMLAALLRRNPEDHRSRVGRAYILLRAQRWREAIQFIEQDLPLIPEDQRRGMLQFQGSAYAALKDEAGVKRTVERYRRLMVGTAAGFSDSYALEARLQQELDHPGSALAAFREAYRINPETRYLAEIAVLAGRLGNHAQRLWAYVELCAREPVGTTYCAVRDQLLKTQPAGTESSATN